MNRRKAIPGTVFAIVLIGATAAMATPIIRGGGSTSGTGRNTRTVTVAAPAAQPRATTTRRRSRPRRPTVYTWGPVTAVAAACDLAGERAGHKTQPAVPALAGYRVGGAHTYYSAALLGPNGVAGYIEWCGAAAQPLPPPNDAWVIGSVKTSGKVSLDAILSDPSDETLTGLDTTMLVQITNAGNIKASNADWNVTAQVTAIDFAWDLDEPGLSARGQKISVLFNKKGPHNLRCTVTFQVAYTVTGLATYSDSATFRLEIERPIKVREARSVLTG